MLIGKHSSVSPVQKDVVMKFNRSIGLYEHISNFKCVSSNDIDENVNFMFDNNVIEVNNMIENFNDVQICVPKADQVSCQLDQKVASTCLCVGT